MDTRDFLSIYTEDAGPRTMGLKVNGWDYRIYMQLAGLTSYLKFNCGFGEGRHCKRYTSKTSKKAPMCCCHACRRLVGFIKQLPANPTVIGSYARLFNDKTGFWSKDGCMLPRSHRSPICLTYNCDVNTCRPDSHKKLISCLKRKNGNMIIDGERAAEFALPNALERWLKKPPTYKTAQGSTDYAP